MRIYADYHIHSRLSPDARDYMEDLCKMAIQKGLREIVFSDHFEFYTPDHHGYPFNQEYLNRYFAMLDACRQTFEQQIIIKSAIEIGQPHCNLDYAHEILSNNKFDYRIGSVHKMGNVDLGEYDYPNIDVDQLCQTNIQRLYELSASDLYDCLGHIDLIKRYAYRNQVPFDMDEYLDELTPVLKNVIQKGKGIEINTSGLRQEVGRAMPSLAILKLYRQLGGEVITVGSDAHIVKDVAAGFSEAVELLETAGFSAYATFQNGVPTLHHFDEF